MQAVAYSQDSITFTGFITQIHDQFACLYEDTAKMESDSIFKDQTR